MKTRIWSVAFAFAVVSLGASEQLVNTQQVYRDDHYRYTNPYGEGVTNYPYYSNSYYYYNPDIYYQSREKFLQQGNGFIDPTVDPHDRENDMMYERNLRSMRENR